MFVSGRVYDRALDEADRLRTELAREQTRREALERQTVRDRALIDFLCTRVNQVEVERAVLLKSLTKTEFPIPSLANPTPNVNLPTNPLDAVIGASMFEDVGDETAKKLGLKWDPDGRVVETVTEREPATV